MRKKILLQIAVIIAVFMTAMLVIIEAAFSYSATRLFIEAKKDFLDRDLKGISGELFPLGYVPELLDYCKKQSYANSSVSLDDPEFKTEYLRVVPGMLERLGAAKLTEVADDVFPELSLDEQAVYARLWYYFLNSAIDIMQEYYGFSCVAVIDASEDDFSRVFCSRNPEDGLGREALERIIADDNKRNGTLSKITKGEKAEAEYGIAYSGETGNWFMGYYPLVPIAGTGKYAVCIAINLQQFNHALSVQLMQILVFGFVLIAVFAMLLIWFLNRKTVKPVTQIQQSVRRYTDDKDSGQIMAEMGKIRVENEFGMLAGDISHLAEEMERYNRENICLVAEQERINTEMNLARDIQASALPSSFPAFPERGEFDLYASMTPAREVGGDFYDFFLINSDHLALVIADVSGKGIPAALFMMTAKSLIKDHLMVGLDPAAALECVNALLSEGNASMMFVTVWLAVVEISTGKGIACNAGHEHPAIRRVSGGFELLRYPHDKIVGPMKKASYHNREFELCPGDCLFVYTDGVPEAFNTAEIMFGEERMIETLNLYPNAKPEELIRHMHDAVFRFAEGAEQFDDITMLCLKYYGAQKAEGNR